MEGLSLFLRGVFILFIVEKTLSTDAEEAGRTTARARSLEMLGNAAVMESQTSGFHIIQAASCKVVG